MRISELNEMLEDLRKYKRPKEELAEMYVTERLSKSLNTYYKTVRDSLSYLTDKNALKVAKKMY